MPAAGDRLLTFALELRGWAVGAAEPLTAVELLADGAVLETVPLDVERPRAAAAFGSPAGGLIGFRALLNTLLLPLQFELELLAVTQEGGRVPLGAVRGRRATLPGGGGPVQPLLLTTLGRTGSMLLQRLLDAHPEILVLRPHRYEQRVAGYWVEVLLALTDPSSYMRQLAPAGSLDEPRWWLGDEGPPAHLRPDEQLHRWLGRDAVVALAELCRARIDALYHEAAAEEGGHPRYFAEKHTLRSAALTAELYPGAREVFLVRDFRDMVASIFAFNRKRGVRGFGEGAASGEVDYVDRLAAWASALVRSFERRSRRAHLVRYEDLVLEPEATLRALLSYLGVDAEEETVARMRESLTADMPELAEHGTAPDPAASIGRWRSDLGDDLKRACERSFADALATFGYG